LKSEAHGPDVGAWRYNHRFYRRLDSVLPANTGWHVEAGLRNNDLKNPFPEEAHRRLIDPLCSLLFAPTTRARQNLINENTDPGMIIVTGNTVVDAVYALTTPVMNLQQRLAEFINPEQRLLP
jgi:UDP-N-acetylglucosamine 2-epimerase (non-hydrolysing)